MKTVDIVDSIYKAYGTDSGILFGIKERDIVKAIVEFTVNRLQSLPGEGVEQAAEKQVIDDLADDVIYSVTQNEDRPYSKIKIEVVEILKEKLAGASWDAGKKDAVDYKAKYEKCIDIIKRFQGHGIIGMYDL